MATNQNQTSSGYGSQNRKPNGQQQKPTTPKLIFRAYPDLSLGAANTYNLFVEVNAFYDGQPMANHEVVLKEKTAVLDRQQLSADGDVLLKFSGVLTRDEQIKNFRVCLSGTSDEKILPITIPAIPKVIVKPKTISVTPANVVCDTAAGTYSAAFQVTVLEDGKPMQNQRVSLKEGITQLAEQSTDNNGQVTFNVAGSLGKTEKNINYRFSLVGFTDNVEQNMTVPASEAKAQDNDPETVILRRYHDGCGNFTVLVRILKSHGQGVKTTFSTWYKGSLSAYTTNDNGEITLSFPNVAPGEHEHLVVIVPGIADEASIDIKRRKIPNKVKAFSAGWWFKTNNGRAFILILMTILAWVAVFIVGAGEPVLNHKMFNDNSADRFYNESIAMVNAVGSTQAIQLIKSPDPWSVGRMAYWGWLIVATILVLIYALFSLREEIMAGIEDGFEKLFDKSYSKAGDPIFEKLAKFVGSYKVARKTPTVVIQGSGANVPASPEPAKHDNPGHPSLLTLFKLDLLSDALVAIVPAIMKKIF